MPLTNTRAVRRALIGWYEKHKRDLPWRRISDPYAIWISETMLQQTQVKTVLPYYERFLKAFPTVACLDQASSSRVLRHWSGLGYYRRAENLKKAARLIVRDHGGAMPQDYAGLRALPGVGDYTASAVLSIAFRKPYAAVDANVRRVLQRAFNINGTELHQAAARLVPRSDPGRFNQGLMELGATLCLPKAPRCASCPLARHCSLRHGDRAAMKENTAVKAAFRDVVWPLAIIRHGRKILLHRRPAAGLLAGLWELPGGEKRPSEGPLSTLRRHLEGSGIVLCSPRRLGEIRHSITHRRIRAPIFLAEAPAGARTVLAASRWRWVAPDTLHRLPVSSMTVKAAKTLLHEKSSP